IMLTIYNYVKRHEIDEIIEWLKTGGKNILIHSDLGNGKTLFIDGLAVALTHQQHNVFKFQKYFDQTDEEIEYLCTKIPKCVIIIEKYSDHLDLLKKISLFRTHDVTVIVSDRSTINDTIYITLEKIIFKNPYLTKNLNVLSPNEIDQLSTILSMYGLWGKHASSEIEKRKIIVDKCKSSFKLLLLHLLNSTDIKNRYNKILEFIEGANESFYDATLLILASNIFDFQLDTDKLTYILDDELLYNPSFNNNDYLKEFINFGTSKIYVRSSILALSILSQPQYHSKLIKLLIRIFLKLDKRSADQNNYRILKSLVSFSRLQSVFNVDNTSHFKAVVLNFYEEVKDTKFASKNPFFGYNMQLQDYHLANIK
ncbi:hypothetical protein, partial [Sphingobacterium sp. IITKGP-BTPF85]|uniref:hypothetical protein n=1 Tax=Sphingobacterium sp. IITKGP-BTPF85 TaxID=1338009 RepID=UPI000389DCD4